MVDRTTYSDSDSGLDRRTYLRASALTLGTLAAPAAASKASANDRELPNSISIVGDDQRAFYRFIVSDAVEARWKADHSDAEHPMKLRAG